MRDLDIRRALRKEMDALHCDEPRTLVVEELGLCQGTIRIDMAVVNGSLHGYEIKSERDTLYRLASQRDTYNQAFDYVTIIAGHAHLDKIYKLVPDWWGIWSARLNGQSLCFTIERPEQQNLEIQAFALAQLLWKNEALEVLEERGCAGGVRTKTRIQIWQRLTEVLSMEQLRATVRDKLKTREGWRVGASQE